MSENLEPRRKVRRTESYSTTVLNLSDRSITQTAGKIEKICLKNVLCHSHLIVELNECVNLIQGRNGSGKSSIVASIIAGFGGSAHMAEKGKSFKNLIQTGKQTATIEITLNNEGVNAFKRDLYGDKILVERKIYLSGVSTYKLKDRNGHVLSQKKEDLTRLLCRFNIMVDNPVVILSQECAKSFLSNATPTNLFKFYMLSTGMKQLISAYEYLESNISHCRMLIETKTENLQKIAKDVKEWERKGQALMSLDKKRRKVTRLRIEKSVAEVNELTAQLNNYQEEKTKISTRIAKITAKMKLLEGEKKEITVDKKKRDEESQSIVMKANELKRQKDDALQELTSKKKCHKERINEIRNMEKQVAFKQNDVSSIRQSLSKDSSIAHRLWTEKNAALAEEKVNLEKKHLDCKQMLDVAMTHAQNLQSTADINADCEHVKHECQALDRRLNLLQRELENFKNNSNNILAIFNPLMPQIIDDIERADRSRSFIRKPVGPIGVHIKCMKQEWVHIAEKILMPIMNSFIVSCKEDFTTLKNVFKNRYNGGRSPKIIVTSFRNQVHDVNRFRVRTDMYQSLWSILDVNNIHAANVVLDQISAETILLIPTSQEAGELLKDARRVPQNCRKAYTLHGDLYFPDPKFRIYSGNGNKHTRYLQVSPKEKILELQENVKYTKTELLNSQMELKEKQEEKKLIEEEYRKNLENQRKYRSMIVKLERNISDLRDKEELPPPDVFQLQIDLKERVSELEEIESKREDLENEAGTLKEEIQELNENYKMTTVNTDECLQQVHSMQESILSTNNRHQKILIDIKRLKEKHTEQQKLVESQFNTNINDLEENIRLKTSQLPESNNAEIETERPVNDIKRELNSLKNAIEAEESKIGDLTEIITVSQEKAANYRRIKGEIDDQRSYIKALNKAVTKRRSFLDVMQKFNETYIKTCFEKAIAKRNMKGYLEIDHKGKLLSISVQKSGEGAATVMRPLSMMSGGEKSFSTVSFILALWDVISSPIRILDEFDVFMDDVARKQVTELMLSSIKNEFQYLFITPLDYSRKASHFNTIV